jgi:hypothetical protein
MPRPGRQRPADAIGNAVQVSQIATTRLRSAHSLRGPVAELVDAPDLKVRSG